MADNNFNSNQSPSRGYGMPARPNFVRVPAGRPAPRPGMPRPVMPMYGMPPYGAPRPQRPHPPVQPLPQQDTKPAKKQRRRKESDHFFVMRKGVCFFIFVLCILVVAVFALNYLNIMPQYTSLFVKPDNTPIDERVDVESEDEVDEEGNPLLIPYEDKSIYISAIDPIFGLLKSFGVLDMKDADGNSMSPFYDEMNGVLNPAPAEEAAEAATEDDKSDAATEDDKDTEEGDTAEGEGIAAVLPENVKPTKPDAELQAQDGMTSIAAMIFKFFPVAMVLMAVTALIAAITSFLGMFNRRIFKGFGLAAIIMLVCAVVTLAAGLVALGNYNGNPQLVDEAVVSVLDFSKIGGFVMQGITGAPATAPTDVTMMNLVFTCGFGMLILLVVPVVILVLSFFARKKVPYSIFDR